MNHATTQNFNPAGFFTNMTSLAITNKTAYIHFCTGLREWEIGRSKTNFCLWSIHLLYKKVKRLFEVRKRNVLINIESFDLMKKAVTTCADGLVSINTTWHQHTNRKFPFFHFPNLNTTGMRTQYPVGILLYIKSILHISCRVMCW